MGDFLPNRNSDVKSILWPPGPLRVRSQNDGYWQYLSKSIGTRSKTTTFRLNNGQIKDK